MSRNFTAGIVLTGAMAAMALLSLAWTPYSPIGMDFLHKLAAPSLLHPLGTDPFGRDELSMIMAGASATLDVAIIAVALGAGIGIPLGALAAEQGGWIDALIMRSADLAFAFPAVLTAVMIAALAGPGAGNAMLAIGIFNIPVFARVTRAAVLQTRELDFVQAASCCAMCCPTSSPSWWCRSPSSSRWPSSPMPACPISGSAPRRLFRAGGAC
jgi:peptide/nickel transport system permease protein